MSKKIDQIKEPQFSKSWDEPYLTSVEPDGNKIVWFEKDLSPEAVEVMEKLLKNLKAREILLPEVEEAQKVIDQLNQTLDLHDLLFEKLCRVAPGKKANIIDGDASLKVASDINKKEGV